MAGAVGGTLAGDYASKEVGQLTNDTLGGTLLTNVAAGAAGAAAGGAIGGASGAISGGGGALSADMYNRQLHPDEKAAIAKKSNGDKDLENKLTRAACYVVQCWAEFTPNSAQYQENFVSIVEAENLKSQIDWVVGQQSRGLFVYSEGQRYVDNVKSNLIAPAKDAAKVITGTIATTTGLGLCSAAGVGCIAGGPMAAMGASDITEGGTGLYRFYFGDGAVGYNPLKSAAATVFPQWGEVGYDVVNFVVSLGALSAPQVLNVGLADGLGRAKSMFGVTVPAFNNVKLLPLTKMPLPGVNQPAMLIGVGVKGVAVYTGVSNAKGSGEK